MTLTYEFITSAVGKSNFMMQRALLSRYLCILDKSAICSSLKDFFTRLMHLATLETVGALPLQPFRYFIAMVNLLQAVRIILHLKDNT